MSRMMLGCVTSWFILSSLTVARAVDAEDKAVALVAKLGGKVIRDENLPEKPVVGVDLFLKQVTDAGLSKTSTRSGLGGTRVKHRP